jgi:tRNA(Ile)-lysidine synthase TilS/MesJ
MRQQDARAVLTAHHADDLIETSIMNVRRGTDRYGAAGGMGRQGVDRPLIRVQKRELLEYARQHKLEWREDSTNTDVKYTRNMIRHNVIPVIDEAAYQKHLEGLLDVNPKIDSELAGLVSITNKYITITSAVVARLSLREVEVLVAYSLRRARPDLELNQRRIAETARQIMLGTHKISFSITATDCIIIDIQ